jgi:hypothetical protein
VCQTFRFIVHNDQLRAFILETFREQIKTWIQNLQQMADMANRCDYDTHKEVFRSIVHDHPLLTAVQTPTQLVLTLKEMENWARKDLLFCFKDRFQQLIPTPDTFNAIYELDFGSWSKGHLIRDPSLKHIRDQLETRNAKGFEIVFRSQVNTSSNLYQPTPVAENIPSTTSTISANKLIVS